MKSVDVEAKLFVVNGLAVCCDTITAKPHEAELSLTLQHALSTGYASTERECPCLAAYLRGPARLRLLLD